METDDINTEDTSRIKSETIDLQTIIKVNKTLSKEKDLEQLVAQVIPILAIDQVIIDRVRATSPEDLELAIQGIVKSELQAIVNLGGILGFTIGLFQMVLLFLR